MGKRQADGQITRDSDEVPVEEFVPMARATPEQMAKREIVRLKRPTSTPQGTGGLFKGISTGDAPTTATSTSSTGGFGGGFGASFAASRSGGSSGGFATLFKPPSEPVSLIAKIEKPEEKGEDSSATTTTPFNFTAPTSVGTKFAPPATGKSLFPPAGSDAFSFGFSNTSENKMAKIAEGEKESFGGVEEEKEDIKVFTPAPPSFKQPETAKGLEVKQDPNSPVEGAENDVTLFSISGVTLLQTKTDAAGARTWSERGEGIVKINQNKNGGVCRVLMWRDQTHQLLLNENLTASTFSLPNVEPKPKAMMFVVLEAGESRTFSFKMKKIVDAQNAIHLHDELKKALEKKPEQEEKN